MVKVGDIVLPLEAREFLYLAPPAEEVDREPDEMVWTVDEVGLVIDVVEYDEPRDYKYISVIVNGIIGWTYSDCVWVVS